MYQSPNRKHDRNSFYKYVSSSTAKIILKNRTLRWSSPVEFNDPFDVPRELLYGVEAAEIKREMNYTFIELVRNPPQNIIDLQPKIQLIVETLRKNNSEEFKNEIIATINQEEIKDDFHSIGLEGIKQLWRDWVPNFRILCLCESHEKTSMWYHYAEEYKGVVIELNCSDDLDSAWLLAEPIKYVNSIPEISTAKGWAKLMLMSKEQIVKKLIAICSYTKTPDWEYEKEWRVASFKRPYETGTTSDYNFNYNELKSIYFGPLIDPEVRDEIIQLSTEVAPHILLFNTEIGMGRSFKFNQIKS
jgi:hypothetical protein